MEQKVEILTSFEETLLFMACRYAIGRNTIAATTLPEDILKYYYGRMSQQQIEHLATDIRHEIYDILAWSLIFKTSLLEIKKLEEFDPITLYQNIFKKSNLSLKEAMSKSITYNLSTDKVSIEDLNDEKDKITSKISQISGILPWANLASILLKTDEVIIGNEHYVPILGLDYSTDSLKQLWCNLGNFKMYDKIEKA